MKIDEPADRVFEVFVKSEKRIEVRTDESGTHDVVPTDAYRATLQRVGWDSPIPYWEYTITISDDNVKTEFRNIIKDKLSRWIANGRIHLGAALDNDGGQDVGRIERNVLDLIVLQGAMQAVKTFLADVSEPRFAYQEVILLDGVTVSDDISVRDGVRLSLLSENTPSAYFDKQLSGLHILPSGVGEDTRTVLIIDRNRLRFAKPMFGKDTFDSLQEVFKPEFGSNVAPQFCEDAFIEWLSVVAKSRVLDWSRWHKTQSPDITTLRWYYTGGGRWHPYRSPHVHELTDGEVQSALALHNIWLETDKPIQDKLKIPLKRLADSMARKSVSDKVLDISIALECLYLDDGPPELKYKLRHRAAMHLYNDYNERSEAFWKLGKLYDVRSAIVHRGNYKYGTEVDELVEYGQTICRAGIEQIMRNGKWPEWERVVLG